MNIVDRVKTQEVIARFANSFDVKHWSVSEDQWRYTLWLWSKQ